MKYCIPKYRLTFALIPISIIYLITAFNSLGYHHPDEHYQIIEFARLKVGSNTPSDLAWEYHSRIRPTIQPTICYGIFKTLQKINITDPYDQALILRLISAILTIFSITFFIKNTEFLISDKRLYPIYHAISYLLWFVPYIGVRFSSENWAGLLFLSSLSVVLNNRNSSLKPLIIGLLLGLSFIFRFQIGLAILGLILWLLIVKRHTTSYVITIIISFTLIVSLGLLIDSWFYNELTFTPWMYFKSNILDNIASRYGINPWYYYIYKLFKSPLLLIGIPIAISFFILLIKQSKNLFLWCIIPFVLIHSIIPHKELRFMFPIVFLFSIVIFQAFQIIIKHKKIYKYLIKYYALLVFFPLNIACVIIMSQKPAATGTIAITKYIHTKYKNKKVHIIHTERSNPYDPYKGLIAKHYSDKNITSYCLKDLNSFNDSLLLKGNTNLIIAKKIHINSPETKQVLHNAGFSLTKQSIPYWIDWLTSSYIDFNNANILVLYSLKN